MPTTGFPWQQLGEKDTAPAYDKDTDSLEAIREAIDAIATDALTAKQKSMLGVGAWKGFQDYIGDAGTANALKSAFWNETTVGASPGVVTVYSTTDDYPVYMELDSGADNNDEAQIDSLDKYMVNPLKTSITTIHLKFVARIDVTDDANSHFDLGLSSSDKLRKAVLNMVTDVAKFSTRNSDGEEHTDISAHVADDTWYTFEIQWTTSDVKFYVDSTLRATHSTRVPERPLAAFFRAWNRDVVQKVDLQYVEMWAE